MYRSAIDQFFQLVIDRLLIVDRTYHRLVIFCRLHLLYPCLTIGLSPYFGQVFLDYLATLLRHRFRHWLWTTEGLWYLTVDFANASDFVLEPLLFGLRRIAVLHEVAKLCLLSAPVPSYFILLFSLLLVWWDVKRYLSHMGGVIRLYRIMLSRDVKTWANGHWLSKFVVLLRLQLGGHLDNFAVLGGFQVLDVVFQSLDEIIAALEDLFWRENDAALTLLRAL